MIMDLFVFFLLPTTFLFDRRIFFGYANLISNTKTNFTITPNPKADIIVNLLSGAPIVFVTLLTLNTCRSRYPVRTFLPCGEHPKFCSVSDGLAYNNCDVIALFVMVVNG